MKKGQTVRDTRYDDLVGEAQSSRESGVVWRPVGAPRRSVDSIDSAAPDTGLYGALRQTHDELLELVEEVLDAKDLEDRAAALRQLAVLLLSHSYAERRSFLASLRHFEQTCSLVQLAIEEQNELVKLLYGCLRAPSGSRAQAAEVEGLREYLVKHVQRAENTLFVLAELYLPRLQEENLKLRYVEQKADYRRQLEEDLSGVRAETAKGSPRLMLVR